MTEGVNFTATLVESYGVFVSSLPSWAQNFINLFLLVLLVFFYSFFIWKFYRFVAKKNILELNLNQYNKTEHPFFTKVVAIGFYLLEYIIILPFMIFFWFGIFTLFLIFLTDSLEIGTLLTMAAVIVAAIRLTCYYKEDLAKDLAKLLPLTLLSTALLNQSAFSFERVLTHFSAIPGYLSRILIYLLFIVIVEVFLRFFDFLFSLFGLEEPEESVTEEKN